MAYDVYTWNGYILDIRNSGEYDKRITLFSKENGLVEAVAISSAKPGSKMRGFLIRFAGVSLDVVHGKTGYRIVRVRSAEKGFTVYKKEAYFVLAKFTKLINHLLPHKIETKEAYDVFEELIYFLSNNLVTESQINNVFYEYALKLLTSLGYTKQPLDLTKLSNSEKTEMYEYILNENGMSVVL